MAEDDIKVEFDEDGARTCLDVTVASGDAGECQLALVVAYLGMDPAATSE